MPIQSCASHWLRLLKIGVAERGIQPALRSSPESAVMLHDGSVNHNDSSRGCSIGLHSVEVWRRWNDPRVPATSHLSTVARNLRGTLQFGEDFVSAASTQVIASRNRRRRSPMPLLSGRLGNPFARRAMSLLALTSLVGYLSLVEASGPANAITGPYTTVFLGNITSTTNAAISNDPPGDPNRTAADPSAVVSDSHGNLIFADSDGAIVLLQESAANPGYPVDSLYVWEPGETRVLGGGGSDALEASGTPALSTDLGTPSAVALDPSGNVVFADNSNGVVGVLAVSSLEPAHLHLGGTWQVGDVYLLAGDPSGASPTTSGSVSYTHLRA